MLNFPSNPTIADIYMPTDTFNYLAESARTASGKFYGKYVDYNKFITSLTQFVSAANQLDRYKKLLFYGEDINKHRFRDGGEGSNRDGYDITNALSTDNETEIKARYILHALLGVMTEAGEMAEALHKVLLNADGNQTLDKVNLVEESGDVKWYLAMLARALDNEWQDDELLNIAKLRARFPDKFSEQNANERDLTAERNILENNAASLVATV